MRKEHTVYFKIFRKDEIKLLRGLIYLEPGAQPTLQDFEQCLKACGHNVRIEDTEKFIFRATEAGEEYVIDVLEDYEKTNRDLHVESLAKTFIKNDIPL